MENASLRRQVVTACRRLYDRGLVAGPDGNVSVLLTSDRILVTPSGLSKVDVTEEDLVELQMDGTRVAGRLEPSSEIAMHLAAYRARPDVRAVVHAHPPVATGLSVAGEGIPGDVLPEVILQMGSVPLVPYATPGTAAVPAALATILPNHDAFLLANHGATTLGGSLTEALQRMESIEHAATILLTARLLGRVNALGATEVSTLLQRRRRTRPVAGTQEATPRTHGVDPS